MSFLRFEAVKTNVFGTENVVTAAIDAGVKKIICLSTDKAACQVNAMGTSKAMMENVIVAKSELSHRRRQASVVPATVMCFAPETLSYCF